MTSSNSLPIEVFGVPASPYTRKLIAVLRYRRIPHIVRWHYGSLPEGYPTPKVQLLPMVFERNATGEIAHVKVDTTPIIREFDEKFEQRNIIPTNPALSFLNDLIEDYADEWLTKAMFHFRWAHKKDAKQAKNLIVLHTDTTLPVSQVEKMAEMFAHRQIGRLGVVGSNSETGELIKASFSEFLSSLEGVLTETPFLFGECPSSADFAIYGQLTQLALLDPTPVALITNNFIRVRAWVDLMEDLSGVETGANEINKPLSECAFLAPLLTEIGATYAPFMVANMNAIKTGSQSVEVQIRGKPWRQVPFPYQAKCLHVLRGTFKSMDADSQQSIQEFLGSIDYGELILEMVRE